MANKNDYNYYKNEYGKYKANYYSPGSEEYKKRESGSKKQKAARFFRAFFVFLIIGAIVVGLVFGIIKLSGVIKDRTSIKVTETTTDNATTAKQETTTKKESTTETKFKKGTVCVVKTNDGTGINLRNKPSYDVTGYMLLVDGTEIVVDKLSDDGEWCKTSNFSMNGWVNVKYLKVAGEEKEENTTKKKEEKTTEKVTEKVPETTTKKPETTTEGKTVVDSNIKSYQDAVNEFKNKGSGTVMNCKIVCNGHCFAKDKPSPSGGNILYLVNGQSVKVTAVSGDFSKVTVTVNGVQYTGQWVSNENLSFVSWG